jgi:site-specific DNA-methyltransferase (adenine-specific)
MATGTTGIWRNPRSYDGFERLPVPRFTVLEERDLDDLRAFTRRWAREAYRIMVPGAHMVVASTPFVSWLVTGAIMEVGFERRAEIIRLFSTMRGGDRPKGAHNEFPDVSMMPRSHFEPWLLFRKPMQGLARDNLRKWKTGGLRRLADGRPFSDVVQSARAAPNERRIATHPSLKPQPFLRQLVRALLPLGAGCVYDPFAGSGSTLAAAEAIGYASVGTEADKSYFSMACRALPALAEL